MGVAVPLKTLKVCCSLFRARSMVRATIRPSSRRHQGARLLPRRRLLQQTSPPYPRYLLITMLVVKREVTSIGASPALHDGLSIYRS